MSKFSNKALGAIALIFCFLYVVDDVDASSSPKYGRPRYEKIDEIEWIFYMTYFDIDWYLESRGELKGNIFEIRARSVKPGSDNFTNWRFNCKNKTMTHTYNEPFRSIPADNRLLVGVYNEFCNLPDSIRGSRNR